MAQYLVLAESIIYKNDKLTCINIYDRLSSIAMPAEFRFDLAVICGPDCKVGEHKLTLKAKANNGKEVDLGEATVNIPHKDFVYNAYVNDVKIIMDYSVNDLTFYVYDNGKEILSRKYPVVPILVPKNAESEEGKAQEAKKEKKKK